MDQSHYVFYAAKHIYLSRMPWFKPLGKNYAEYEFYISLYYGYKSGAIHLPEYLGFTQYDIELYRGEESMLDFIDKQSLRPHQITSFQPQGFAFLWQHKRAKASGQCWTVILEKYNQIYGTSFIVDDLKDARLDMFDAFFLHRDVFLSLMEFVLMIMDAACVMPCDRDGQERLMIERYVAFFLWAQKLDRLEFPLRHFNHKQNWHAALKTCGTATFERLVPGGGGVFLCDSRYSKEGVWIAQHDAGFYSCSSVVAHNIFDLLNNGFLIRRIDSTQSFRLCKDVGRLRDDIFRRFFVKKDDLLPLTALSQKGFFKGLRILEAVHNCCYKNLRFERFQPVIDAYFSPSAEIVARMKGFIDKYKIDPTRTIAVVYRGTDKAREVKLAPPEAYLDLAQQLLNRHPDCRVLIQTDQLQVRRMFCNALGEKCFYIEELPATETDVVMHTVIKENKLNWALDVDAAMRVSCGAKILINHTGNVAFFLALYRGHARGMYQFDKEAQLIEPIAAG